MKYLSILLFMAIWSYNGVYATDFDHRHSIWTDILRNEVTVTGHTSTVNYKDLKDHPVRLNQYLKLISSVTHDEFITFDNNQKLAFLINSYNALTIKLIVDHYPVKSIKDLGSFFSSPWKKKFIKLFNEDLSLDDIEHEKIRKNFAESRIHFALVCASKGCPALLNEAYVAEKLEQQLENSARNFLLDPERNRFHKERSTLELSPIFKWYSEDFVKYNSGVKNFVANRLTSDQSLKTILKRPQTTIEYLDYDWTLNEKKN